MSEIVDIVLFNNEMDILDLRVKLLEDVVDRFIIKESPFTFQGAPKLCSAREYVHPKVEIFSLEYPPDMDAWSRERFHREISIEGVNFDDIVMTSDIDEIPDPVIVGWLRDNFNSEEIYIFEQKMYQYYLNIRSLVGPWNGTRACSGMVYYSLGAHNLRQKKKSLCHNLKDAGWHWSFLGGEQEIIRKIQSYSHYEHNNERDIGRVINRFHHLTEVYGKPFPLQIINIDETFPEYIRDHQKELAHLIKKEA